MSFRLTKLFKMLRFYKLITNLKKVFYIYKPCKYPWPAHAMLVCKLDIYIFDRNNGYCETSMIVKSTIVYKSMFDSLSKSWTDVLVITYLMELARL